MNRKRILFTLFGSVLFFGWHILPTAAATVEPQLISDSWTIDRDDVVYATRDDGTMALAYPASDESGVYYHYYNPTLGSWNEASFLENTEFTGDKYTKIKDLTLVDLYALPDQDFTDQPPTFVTSWTSEYYMTGEDGSEVFLGAEYNWYTGPGAIDSDNAPQNTVTQADEAMLHIQPGGADTFWGLWNDNDILYAQHWVGQDDWTESEPVALSAVASPTDFETTSVIINKTYEDGSSYYFGKEYIFSDSTGDVKGGVIGEPFTYTFTIAEDAELLNITTTADNNIYILYRQDSDIKRQLLNTSDNTLSDTVTVMPDVKPRTTEVAYNDYGQGQYVVLVSTYNGNEATLRYSMENANGWVKNQVFSTKHYVIGAPQLRTFSTGEIEFVWSANNIWRYKQYTPTSKIWSKNIKIDKQYDDLKLMNPLRQSAVRTSDGKFYIDRLRAVTDQYNQQLLYKSNFGTDVTTATGYSLEPDYQRNVHEVNGDYHFIIVQKDDTLKSIIATEDELFAE